MFRLRQFGKLQEVTKQQNTIPLFKHSESLFTSPGFVFLDLSLPLAGHIKLMNVKQLSRLSYLLENSLSLFWSVSHLIIHKHMSVPLTSGLRICVYNIDIFSDLCNTNLKGDEQLFRFWTCKNKIGIRNRPLWCVANISG